MLKDLLYKTGRLVKFNFKKDKKYIGIWLIVLIISTFALAQYYIGTPMTEEEKIVMLETLKSPAMVLIVGTAPDVTPTESMLFALEMTLFTVIIVAIMNIFLVTRNTRNDEENGRLELIRALQSGRLSILASSLIQAFIVNLALALGVGLSLSLVDFGTNSVSNGILYGFILGTSGFMFAMITAVITQFFQSNRTVIISSFAFIGINFVFRGITDINNPALSWISPLSWSYKTEVYVNNYWIPIILMLITGIIMGILALYFNSIRDLDGCFIKQKPGKEYANKSLLKPFGLVSRLNRTTLIAWIAGIVVLGLTFGSVFGDLENFFASNERLQMMFPGATGEIFTKQFTSMIATIFSIVIAIPALTFIGRISSEEKKNHMENIVSKKITRNKILGSYLKFTLITNIVFVILAIFSIYGTGYNTVSLNNIIQAMITFIPAILFMIGLGIFLVGVIPKLFGIVWAILGYAFFITYFGGMLELPEWVMSISPFYHVPLVPAEELTWTPLIILVILGTVLTIIGFRTYNRRDITA